MIVVKADRLFLAAGSDSVAADADGVPAVRPAGLAAPCGVLRFDVGQFVCAHEPLTGPFAEPARLRVRWLRDAAPCRMSTR